jgi:hypothetical protein
MSREAELASVREQVSILADQVVHLVGMISRQDEAGRDSVPAQEKLAVLESLMWKLHARHTRLKSMLH